MPDAIPSARYRDDVFEVEFVCNGTVEEDGQTFVVAEYDDISETISIPLTVFRNEDTIELIEHPNE